MQKEKQSEREKKLKSCSCVLTNRISVKLWKYFFVIYPMVSCQRLKMIKLICNHQSRNWSCISVLLQYVLKVLLKLAEKYQKIFLSKLPSFCLKGRSYYERNSEAKRYLRSNGARFNSFRSNVMFILFASLLARSVLSALHAPLSHSNNFLSEQCLGKGEDRVRCRAEKCKVFQNFGMFF